ncbi:tail fiber protein [Cyclobacterium marinum]|uniref:Tail Collar domain protein n=1 Tax=Cyclobacterium marinum (strain ATCC 25205 / DSM 745 / LMG 13164 / NCIMB 1802) TaxID=880070 RepID=G0J6Z1_CYCMS|nr:tail fiber protein [Cyclobacterium marinum]AEL26882.1 Tail Collar domain protein [Cyclobacterium marinum DSM 745]
MKTQLILIVLIVFSCSFSLAQTSAEMADIAIQGIARDDNNTAKANAQISLTFEFYYLDKNNGNAKVEVGAPETVILNTDAFGVFSHVISPAATNNSIFANQQIYLKITEGNVLVSEEKLKHVPYAISANNGVPTGAIMPFVGSTAPIGWVLCDGQSLTNINGAENLIALLGSTNAPDLRAMFLRGVGVNADAQFADNRRDGGVNSTQQDSNMAHNHSVDLTTSNNGEHSHPLMLMNRRFVNDGNSGSTAFNIQAQDGGVSTVTTDLSGIHTHAVSGNTSSEGTESRPINYGVNYIIKL